MRFLRPCLVLLALAGLTTSALPATYSILNAGQPLVLNPDGTIDSRYPAGDKNPQVPTLSCNFTGFPSLSGLTTGTPFSSSIRAKLSGTAAATATLGVTATGTNSNKWLISGDNLVNDGTLAGSGTLFATATISGNTVNCATVSWSYVAPPSTDTTPPTKVTGLRQSGSATGTVDLTWNASSDPRGAVAGVGVDHYNIYRNATLLTTQATSLGLQSALTTTNVGAGSGTNTCTQSGTDWTVVGAGTGLDGAADQFVFCNAPISGSYVSVTAEVTAQSLPAAVGERYAKGGVGLHATQLADSAAVDAYVLQTSFAPASYLLQISQRTGTGLNRANLQTTALSALPTTIQLIKSGTTITVNMSSDHGATWVSAITPFTTSLPSSLYGGLIATLTNAGTSSTVAFANVNLNDVPDVTKTVTSASAATFTVRSVDGSGNEALAFPGITGTPGTPPSGTAKKWRTGHYLWIGNQKGSAQNIASNIATMQDTCNNPNIKGYLFGLYWGDMESTQGNYNAGFAIVDQYKAAAAACGNKKIMIRFYERIFGSLAPSNLHNGYYFPTYISETGGDNGGSGIYSLGGTNTLHTIARVWEQRVMDRIIALYQAYGARYDTDRNFEMITMEETGINSLATNGGYTDAAYLVQLQRWMPAAVAAWPHTTVRFQINYFISAYAQVQTLVQTANTLQMAIGGPDTTPVGTLCGWDWGDLWYMGYNPPPNCQTLQLRNNALPQFKYKIPMVAEVQNYSQDGQWTPNQIWLGGKERGAQYFIWQYPYSGGQPGGLTPATVVNFINSISGAVDSTACPTSYSGCDTAP